MRPRLHSLCALVYCYQAWLNCRRVGVRGQPCRLAGGVTAPIPRTIEEDLRVFEPRCPTRMKRLRAFWVFSVISSIPYMEQHPLKRLYHYRGNERSRGAPPKRVRIR